MVLSLKDHYAWTRDLKILFISKAITTRCHGTRSGEREERAVAVTVAIIRSLKFQLSTRSRSEINDPLSRRNFPRLVVSARSEFRKGSGMYAVTAGALRARENIFGGEGEVEKGNGGFSRR